MQPSREPLYGREGSCLVGPNYWLAKTWNWPFAGMYIYRNELVVSMSFQRYVFRREEISSIYRYPWGLGQALRIEHSLADIPACIVFMPGDLENSKRRSMQMPFPLSRRKIEAFRLAARNAGIVPV